MAETDNDGSWYRDKQWLIQLMMVADADMNYDWYKEEWWIIKWIEKADIEWSNGSNHTKANSSISKQKPYCIRIISL